MKSYLIYCFYFSSSQLILELLLLRFLRTLPLITYKNSHDALGSSPALSSAVLTLNHAADFFCYYSSLILCKSAEPAVSVWKWWREAIVLIKFDGILWIKVFVILHNSVLSRSFTRNTTHTKLTSTWCSASWTSPQHTHCVKRGGGLHV